MNLYETTFNLIKDRPASISLDDIHQANKKIFSYSWLCKFHAGEIKNPTYKKLQTLHDYLVSKAQKKSA